MEWLRCNKCYREMKKSNRTYSLTQCGHLYCNRCLPDVTAKCAVCGTRDFKTMPFTNPPKLEIMRNFFTPVDEVIEMAIKIEAFQNNQLSVVVGAFEAIEKKYENMKKMYWNGMKEMNLLSQAFQKLHTETDKLKAIRDNLLKAKEAEHGNPELSGSSFLRYAQELQNQRFRGHFSTPSKSENERISNLPRQYADQRKTQTYLATDSFLQKPKLQTPDQAYDSRDTPCSSRGTNSEGYASGSGFWSIPGSTSSRTGVFRVPSIQKVPKSAATLKKKTPTP